MVAKSVFEQYKTICCEVFTTTVQRDSFKVTFMSIIFAVIDEKILT